MFFLGLLLDEGGWTGQLQPLEHTNTNTTLGKWWIGVMVINVR